MLALISEVALKIGEHRQHSLCKPKNKHEAFVILEGFYNEADKFIEGNYELALNVKYGNLAPATGQDSVIDNTDYKGELLKKLDEYLIKT